MTSALTSSSLLAFQASSTPYRPRDPSVVRPRAALPPESGSKTRSRSERTCQASTASVCASERRRWKSPSHRKRWQAESQPLLPALPTCMTDSLSIATTAQPLSAASAKGPAHPTKLGSDTAPSLLAARALFHSRECTTLHHPPPPF